MKRKKSGESAEDKRAREQAALARLYGGSNLAPSEAVRYRCVSVTASCVLTRNVIQAVLCAGGLCGMELSITAVCTTRPLLGTFLPGVTKIRLWMLAS